MKTLTFAACLPVGMRAAYTARREEEASGPERRMRCPSAETLASSSPRESISPSAVYLGEREGVGEGEGEGRRGE